MKRCLLLMILAVPPAFAHGTADNHLQIMVIGDRVKMNMVVDMRVLGIADADDDGYASLDELAVASHRLEDWVRRTLDVRDASGNSGDVVFADVTSDLNIAKANGDRVDHARILQTLAFADAVSELRLDLGGLASIVPELRVTVTDAASGMRYRLRDPRAAQTVRLPRREGGETH